MPATKNRRPATIAGCPVATFDAARDNAFNDMLFELAAGGSMMYIGGDAICHHVNAIATAGNLVCRTNDMSRAATVAAHHRHGMVTIAKLDEAHADVYIFEVWAVQR